jgi:hypothetical protein
MQAKKQNNAASKLDVTSSNEKKKERMKSNLMSSFEGFTKMLKCLLIIVDSSPKKNNSTVV